MQLDRLAVAILKKVAIEPGMSIKTLCERIDLPRRNFYYRRARINDWLRAEGLTPLMCDPRFGVRLGQGESTELFRKLATLEGPAYKLSAEERRNTLLLYLACNSEPTFIPHLIKLNRVSRNTTLNDLRLLKKHLPPALSLTVNRKQGYQICGSALVLRLTVQQVLQQMLRYADRQAEGHIARLLFSPLAARGWNSNTVQKGIDELLQYAEQQLCHTFTDKAWRILHYMLLFSVVDTLKGNCPELTPVQGAFLRGRSECVAAFSLNAALAQWLTIPELSGNALFFSLLLSSSKTLPPGQPCLPKDRRLMAAVKQLISDFQLLSGIYFREAEQLEIRLFSHLGPAICRCLFDMQSENTLREEILLRYPLIYRLCRQSITRLEQTWQVQFSDDELSYIVISFAAWLDRRPETGEQHVLLVTEGGLSSTAILENQLRNLTVLPLYIESCSVRQLQQRGAAATVRFIVSTVPLPCPVPACVGVIQTRHMLTETEKQQLRLMLEHNMEAKGIEELVTSATRRAPQKPVPLRQAFSAIISHFIHRPPRISPVDRHSAAWHTGFSASQSGWRQLIRKAARPLVDEGIIDRQYADGIIRQIESKGIPAYLAPDILLLHGAPPAGRRTGALSLLKLKHPLVFTLPSVKIQPKIIVILVPTETLSHIPLLEALNRLISDDVALDRLLNAVSLQEVQRCVEGMGIAMK